MLKFFFDRDTAIPDPQVPTSDGLKLKSYAYTNEDVGLMTMNRELNKLAHNVSFGHGIHAGIPWRSNTDASILLCEAVAMRYLRDKARTYNEKLTVQFTKLDGTLASITNP